LIGRLLLVAIFLIGAYDSFSNFSSRVVEMQRNSFPAAFAPMGLYSALGLSVIGSILIITSADLTLGSLLLMLFLVPVTYFMHFIPAMQGKDVQVHTISLMKNVALVGALIVIAVQAFQLSEEPSAGKKKPKEKKKKEEKKEEKKEAQGEQEVQEVQEVQEEQESEGQEVHNPKKSYAEVLREANQAKPQWIAVTRKQRKKNKAQPQTQLPTPTPLTKTQAKPSSSKSTSQTSTKKIAPKRTDSCALQIQETTTVTKHQPRQAKLAC